MILVPFSVHAYIGTVFLPSPTSVPSCLILQPVVQVDLGNTPT
jgi:hypothetical protein